MSRNGRVLVAMSGGVDSAVAACLLREQGYDCVGVFMRVGAAAPEPVAACRTSDAPAAGPPRRLRHGCCSASDADDARAVAGRLGIPFYALNFESEFDSIIEYFIDEYAAGRTPNPCVQCNNWLKFGRLLAYADVVDAQFVATGHYARTVPGAGGAGVRLARARNLAKDQSYVLFGIRAADLSRCLFPLGEFADKAEVRGLAARLGLRVHDKPDSQEICFVPDQNYRGLLDTRRPGLRQPGEFKDEQGNTIGRHEGVAGYTIGQRRGLGLARGAPVYVTRLDVLNNVVTIGPRESLLHAGLRAERLNWLAPPPAGPTAITCKIRHQHAPAAAQLECADGAAVVRFDEPQTAVTPGQAAVFYDGDVVLGGGWIERSLP